jgi:hypothetical protein
MGVAYIDIDTLAFALHEFVHDSMQVSTNASQQFWPEHIRHGISICNLSLYAGML